MSREGTTTGVCSKHRGMPVLSHCVTCGKGLCSKCIVRTPVGFKCSSCTGGQPEGPVRSKEQAGSRSEGGRRLPGRPGGLGRPGASEDGRRRAAEEREAREERRAQRREARGEPTGHWRVAVVLVGLVAVLGGLAYLIRQAGSQNVGTLTPTTGRPAAADISVQFAGAAGHQLFGTLLLPPVAAQRVPGVVIVGDWGSVDRNGAEPAGGLPDLLYQDLAQTLLNHGIASLRYDPAGQGQSTVVQGSPLRFQDLVTDAGAALTTLSQRVVVDPSRLVVVGAGYGGLVALQLAAQDRRVERLALISTPGRPVIDDLSDQLLATAISPAEGQLEVQQLHRAVTTLEANGSLPGAGDLETALRPLLPQGQAAYLRSLFAIDPTAVAAKVHAPALIVRGGQDPAVTTEDLRLLAAALGFPSQAYVAPNAGATLTDVTRTYTTAPVPIPEPVTTLAPGVSTTAPRPANVVVTTSRDQVALTTITDFVTGAALGVPTPSASADVTPTTSPGGGSGTTILPFGNPMDHPIGAP